MSGPNRAARRRRVSGSEFKTFRRCKRQWWLTYGRGFRTPTVKDGALTLGSLTHLGQEFLYEGGTLDAALDAIRDDVMEKLPLAVDQDAWLKQGYDAQNFIVGYEEWLRSTGADQRFEHIASEEELEMPLTTMPDGTEWVLMGKLDRRVYDRMTEMKRFMDFKSVATFDGFTALAPRDEQFPTYEMLLRHNYPGERVMGGLWRMIRKVKRARDGDGDFFRDYEVSFNEQFLESVRQRYVSMAYEMHDIERRMASGELHNYAVYPTPTFTCSWDCQFVVVCDMFDDGSRVESALQELYVVGDPYDRYKIINKKENEDG